MRVFAVLIGLGMIGTVLIDTFETILQPRRVTHKYRFARFFYRTNWRFWTLIARTVPAGKRRESMLAYFGPLSLLELFSAWVIGLVFGFALVNWGAGERILTADSPINFFSYLYMSGTTFFTLGYGDVTPLGYFGRAMAVTESGLGFAFLAMIISYLPSTTQAFSSRETTISLLDARASSPPCAAQLLVRLARGGNMAELSSFLAEWERWSAELLESHLSFPVLSYFRSQHDNQSWLAAITCMLDTCAIVMAEVKGNKPYRAQLTFAMARHAVVDLSLIFGTGLVNPESDRLPPETRIELHKALREAGLELHGDAESAAKLTELRGMYEPFVGGLSKRFLFALPPIFFEGESIDNWQRSRGMRRAPGLGNLATGDGADEHFGS